MADKSLSYNIINNIFNQPVPSTVAYQHLAKHVTLLKEILWEEMSLVHAFGIFNNYC